MEESDKTEVSTIRMPQMIRETPPNISCESNEEKFLREEWSLIEPLKMARKKIIFPSVLLCIKSRSELGSLT